MVSIEFVYCYLEWWFSSWVDFIPPGAWWHCCDSFGYHMWKVVLLASGGYRPEMMLNILQCKRQPPQQEIFDTEYEQ